ncbi:MAG: AbrB/MazE/SpoVT family DNA-binding domain-containing protein [Desulfococcaceae bacterium]
MITSIKKWGNSLAVRIPRTFTNEMKIKDGSRVSLESANGMLYLKPAKKYSLDELIEKIDENNLHAEISTG